VTEDDSFRRGGATANHVLIAAADIGRDNLQNHAMFALATAQRQDGKINILNFNHARPDISNPTVGRHRKSSSFA
jgi:hypothetical protein